MFLFCFSKQKQEAEDCSSSNFFPSFFCFALFFRNLSFVDGTRYPVHDLELGVVIFVLKIR